GVAAAPIYNVAQVFQDPHVRQRGLVVEMRGPYGAVKAIRAPGSSAALDLGNYTPPPALGEHTIEVLRGLGYSDEEIRRLIEGGAARAGKI
ncbi:MAG: CoA transferase, partial [Thermoproteus sp.]